MPLQHDYRPDDLDSFFGNDNEIRKLQAQLNRHKEKRPFAYLIVGPAGCGKTTLAYIIRKKLGCSDLDFIELDASSERGIQNIRDVKEMLGLVPNGDIKAVLFDEVHGVTGPAQEAMLKMLENPPPDSAIILCTTEAEKLKPTIKRRCHIVNLEPIDDETMVEFLGGIIEAEGFDEYPEEAIQKIAKVSNGAPGIALKILDSIIDLDDYDAIIKGIESASYGETAVIEICRILVKTKRNANDKWNELRPILSGFSGDAEGVRRMILAYFDKVLLNENTQYNTASDITEMMKFFTDHFYDAGKFGLSMACWLAVYDGVENDTPF